MKNLLIASAVALSLMAAPTVAFAQDDAPAPDVEKPSKPKDLWLYADANLALMQFSVTEGNTEYVSDMMTASFFRGGVKYKYVGAEIEFGQGLSDYEEDGITIGVGSQVAAFGMVRLPAENFDMYLRLGYHSSTLEVSDGTLSEDFKDEGIAGGIGGNYFFNENIGIRLDITNYNLSDPFDVSYVGGSIGGVVKF